MASQIINILVFIPGDPLLWIAYLDRVGEIRIHESKYHVLSRTDKVIGVYDPTKVNIRVNLSDHEIGSYLKS